MEERLSNPLPRLIEPSSIQGEVENEARLVDKEKQSKAADQDATVKFFRKADRQTIATFSSTISKAAARSTVQKIS